MTHETLLHGLHAARRWAAVPLAVLLVALATTAFAPDAVQAQDVDDPAHDQALTDDLIVSAAKAANDAGLTDAQSSAVRSILEQAEPAPGVLWTVAGSIHQEIGTEATRAYAESLRPDRSEMRGRRGGPRGNRGRSGQRGGLDGSGMENSGVERLFDQLDVTDEQKEQIAAIRSRYRGQMRDVRSGRGRPSLEEREQIQALRDEMQAEMRSVLTAEQVAELDEIRGQRMAARAERRVERHAARDAALNLTEEQAKQLSALRGEVRANRQRGERPNRSAMREAVTEILNEDQQAVFELHRSLVMHARTEMGPNRPRGPRRGGRG